MTPEPSTSIVLPVHDQAAHLEGIVRAYASALEGLGGTFELILVTNACTDDSVAVATRLAAELQPVTTLDRRQGGWGHAVRAGLAEARGDILCYTNSARTSPETLTLMITYARVYPNVVLKANRRLRDNLRRRIGGLLYNLECRALFGISTWDVNGTPKVFPRSYGALLELTRDDDLVDLEFMLVCRDEGYPVVEVPIPPTPRHGGRSTTNYRSALRMYVGAYALARTRGLR